MSGDLPNTTDWLPKKTSDSIAKVFLNTCKNVEKELLLRRAYEMESGVTPFDSGIAFEEIFREALSKLLPKRYTIACGTVNDSKGFTAGDCDVLIFNDLWFSKVKDSLVKDSRKVIYPIEGIYAVGEVKQTLGKRTLDQAMEKLVTCHRLHRPRTMMDRTVENREGSNCTHGLSNPLYSFVFAGGLEKGTSMDDLVDRFVHTNRLLKRLEVIRCFCILNEGCLYWSWFDSDARELRPALFMLEDLYDAIVPSYAVHNERNPAFLSLVMNLFLHLYKSVLAPEDWAVSYSYSRDNPPDIKVPKSQEHLLPPDKDWLDHLSRPCEQKHSIKTRDNEFIPWQP